MYILRRFYAFEMCIRDSVHGLAFAHPGDDLALGEHGALRGDGDNVLGRQGQVGDLGQRHLEAAGHGLIEPAGAGGASSGVISNSAESPET